MRRAFGFTLVELMIVVAVIAILAAIAVPAYNRYGFRARRVDGQELLLRIANAEERAYSTNNQYTATVTDLGYPPGSTIASEKGYYNVTLATSGSSSQAYTATAAPTGIQASDLCGSLIIDNTGTKSPGPASASSNANGSCW